MPVNSKMNFILLTLMAVSWVGIIPQGFSEPNEIDQVPLPSHPELAHETRPSYETKQECSPSRELSPASLKASLKVLTSKLHHEFPRFTFTESRQNKKKLAISIASLDSPSMRAGYHSDWWIYPASTVKLYYAAAYCHWLGDPSRTAGKPKLLKLEESAKQMIQESNNEATGRIVDGLTGTLSNLDCLESDADELLKGVALSGNKIDLDSKKQSLFLSKCSQWLKSRRTVERYFRGLGFQAYLREKTWDNEPKTPIDRLVRAVSTPQGGGYNLVTSDGITNLMLDLYRPAGQSKTKLQNTDCGRKLKSWLNRDDAVRGNDRYQKVSFLGQGLPSGSHYSSKAGWTSIYYHDVAFIELPNRGARYVLSVLTKDLPPADRPRFFKVISRHFVQYFSKDSNDCN